MTLLPTKIPATLVVLIGLLAVAGEGPARGHVVPPEVGEVLEDLASSRELASQTEAGAAEGLSEAPRAAAAASADASPVVLSGVRSVPLLARREGALRQALRLDVQNPGAPVTAQVAVDGATPVSVVLLNGNRSIDVEIPAVDSPTQASVQLAIAGQADQLATVVVEPVRAWELYLLPQSHVDIGWTKPQEEILADQRSFIEQGISMSKDTQQNPDGSVFKWNVEVLWAVDGYLEQATPSQRADFLEAVENGWLGLDALYGNALTGLHSREELVHLLDEARELREQYGFSIDSAMITDLPGYTWGMVPVLADSGIRYWSIGANSVRAGNFHRSFDDRPFYWVSPDGEREVLTWSSGAGYSFFALNPIRDGTRIVDLLDALEDRGYPYDITYLRYTIFDNFGPDLKMSDFVRDWNAEYLAPRLRIATTREPFVALESRYGDELERFRGDWSPYWEDGAASTAFETALNRNSVQRMEQAERLWSMLDPAGYPAEDFARTWRKLLLFDEHSWGAYSSIMDPAAPLTLAVWERKRAHAIDGDEESRALLRGPTQPLDPTEVVSALRVYNTSSWSRSELVRVPADWVRPGDRVRGDDGALLPSQRLSTGELAFVAADVPALGSRSFGLEAGEAVAIGNAEASGLGLSNGSLALSLDPVTGAVASLVHGEIPAELVDSGAGSGLGEYLYVSGRDPQAMAGSGAVSIDVKEGGPLVATLSIDSQAPGVASLSREVTLVSGFDQVFFEVVVDKLEVFDPEAVHVGFPLSVPGAVPRLDTPWAVVEVDTNQLDGSNKNHFAVQGFVDLSNDAYGVTWSALDTPLIELGGVWADAEEVGYLEDVGSTAQLFSFAMNNYWFTNYKAAQPGLARFRYRLRPHASPFDAAAASKFGEESRQPLVAVPAKAVEPATSLLQVEPEDVHVSTLKPAADGASLVVRLQGAGLQAQEARLSWRGRRDVPLHRSDLNETIGPLLPEPIPVPAQGMVTVIAAVPEPGSTAAALAALVAVAVLAKRRRRA